jgi:membrane-bound lytic murein transglycosylase
MGPRPIGERRGDDTGGAIRGFHFDHFVGAGQKSMHAWDQAGGNIPQARVKYLGV